MDITETTVSAPESLAQQISRLFSYIGKKRKIQFSLLLLLTVLSSFAEVVSLGAVVPFIGILTEPERVYQQAGFQWVIEALQISSPAELVLPLTMAFAIAAVIAGCLRLFLLWVGIRLGNATGADLGIKIFQKTLYQPYEVHISRHSSEVISVITQKVGTATSVLISMVTFLTSLVLFIAILATLLAMDPVVAIVACISFGSAYFFIARITRKRIVSNSRQIANEQTQVIRSLQEGLGAIRDVLLNNAQYVYSNLYRNSILQLQKAQSENTFINQAPRFAMEALGLVLIALLSFTLSKREGGMSEALPLLALLALGAQRLLPLMQQIYGNWSVLAGSKASLQDVLDFLEQSDTQSSHNSETKPMSFNEKIVFSNVSFKYGDNLPEVLMNLNLEINRGDRVGFMGETGSGKSTLLDLLMGLLEPSNGKIYVDDCAVDKSNRYSWQKVIAHVPQHIFLSDVSFTQNIAFGIPRAEIDMQLVKDAADQARISDFIEAKPENYQTNVGERGVRISGGERQRIGIARALYRKARVLVFDEATSALDNKTEQEVMQAIDDLSDDLTVLIIAHRLSTLKNCNKIVELENGCIKRIGTYEELVGNNV